MLFQRPVTDRKDLLKELFAIRMNLTPGLCSYKLTKLIFVQRSYVPMLRLHDRSLIEIFRPCIQILGR